jgi:hypothetical protein
MRSHAACVPSDLKIGSKAGPPFVTNTPPVDHVPPDVLLSEVEKPSWLVIWKVKREAPFVSVSHDAVMSGKSATQYGPAVYDELWMLDPSKAVTRRV